MRSKRHLKKNALLRRTNTDRRLAIEDHLVRDCVAACSMWNRLGSVYVLVVLGILGEVIKN